MAYTEESALFSFDPSTSLLTMIGSTAVNLSTRYYDVFVQIGDETGNWVRDVHVDSITVFWGVM